MACECLGPPMFSMFPELHASRWEECEEFNAPVGRREGQSWSLVSSNQTQTYTACDRPDFGGLVITGAIVKTTRITMFGCDIRPVTSVFCLVCGETNASDFIFGGEAKRVCKAYKKICPSGKVCALQSIDWPRSMKFPVCVHEKKIVVKSRLCRRPPHPGKCGAQFVRWYFNVHMGACSWFTYSGCGGNRNNFRTAAECERRCVSQDSQREEDVVVQEGDNGDNRDNENSSGDGNREPVTALARAAEDLDLDVSDSSIRNNNSNNRSVTTRDQEAERRRRKELRRKTRKERRRRRKELEKLRRSNSRNHVISWMRGNPVTTTPRPPPRRRRPSRKLTVLELGPNYGLVTASPSQPSSWSSSTSSTGRVVISRSDDVGEARRPAERESDRRAYLEARGRGVTRYDPDRGEDRPIWLMDELLKQKDRRDARRRQRRRNRQNRQGGGSSSWKKPEITITVHSFPTSSRLPRMRLSDSSANRNNNVNDNSSRNGISLNQSYRPIDSLTTDRGHVMSGNLADAPTVSQDAQMNNASLKKPYYDKLKLFDILEEQTERKL
ncbi:hypothetical protein EGW08_005328 [Elysia chlorotica]|uniref:BPTI/Kunitz inhibitor domain-containing protein n=1 Tax=Elysia chlorotica TaxID=188477 RepID=A0A433TZB2_ELYCH|nr:hypothetical protein EGW08_005328 [Elysia chlorotica]